MFSEGHMLRGKILARKGQYKEAWSEMSVSLFMNPDLLSERNILYNVLQSVQTKTEKAIRDTHEQLISQELRMNSLVESSFIAMRDKKFANAINDLNEFLVYAPQDINAQFNLAISYKEIGEYNNCLKVLSRINKANPDNKRVHKEMAMVYAYCTFDAEKAIYEIDRHLSIYPDDPDRALLEKARNELKRQ
jgi:tetratricopeptide (TPR) repeat protein